MYDTIIVFDRIRENVPRMPRAAFSQIVNRSMSEVLTRSLITGLSTVFLIGVLLVFGGETLRDFAFAMMVGVASGTYSSIFIASPVLTALEGARARLPLAPGPDRGGDGLGADLPRGQRGRPDRRGRAPRAERRSRRRRRRAGPRPQRPPAPAEAPVAVADPPVERAAAPEPTAEEADAAVRRAPGGRGRADAEPPGARKKQSRRRRKHGR